MSARQAEEPIPSSQTEKGIKRKHYENRLYRLSSDNKLPSWRGKGRKRWEHRRKNSIPEMRDSWKEAVAVPPNTRVDNFCTESVWECCLASVPHSSQEWRNTTGQLHRIVSVKIPVEKREGKLICLDERVSQGNQWAWSHWLSGLLWIQLYRELK